MATVEIQCPECENPLKVPDSVFGKKIKCKQCDHAFVVKDPNAKAVKPSKPGGGGVKPSKPGGAGVKVKKEEEPKEEPKPAAAPYKPLDDDDDDANQSPITVMDGGEDIARCPFCAKELDPPDAVICIHCGFNNVTRVQAESKKVWAPDSSDWMNHLGPGILALVLCIGLITFDIICLVNMEEWLRGTFLESDTADVTDPSKKKLYVKPGAFIALLWAFTVVPIIGTARFAIKRLAINYRPEEKLKK
jgi:hypothetical protein